MSITDDPIADFNRWDAEQQAALNRLPRCARCKNPIQDDTLYDFDGELVCHECIMEYLSDKYEQQTDEYIR